MKLTLAVKLFFCGMRQIIKDGILLMLLPAPFLVGLVFKLAAHFSNSLLAGGLLKDIPSFSLQPWFGLMDGFLLCLTPLFTAMISAFLLLEERDEDICAYYRITPVDRMTYLLARIGLPIIGAFFTTVVVMIAFGVSGLSVGTVFIGAGLSALTAISLAMMLVSLAGNRVEGLALSKLMGVSLLGLMFVWFIPEPFCNFAAFLPSFWIGRLLMDGPSLLIVSVGTSLCSLWIILFAGAFHRRI